MLSKAPNVVCYTPEHQAFTVAAVVILVFVTAVVPVLVLMVNYVSVVGETQHSAVSKVLHKALGSIGRSIQQLSNGSLLDGQEQAVAEAEAALAQAKAAAAAVDAQERALAVLAQAPAAEGAALAAKSTEPAGAGEGASQAAETSASGPDAMEQGAEVRRGDESDVVGEEVEMTEVEGLTTFQDALCGSDAPRVMNLSMSFHTMRSGMRKSCSNAEVGGKRESCPMLFPVAAISKYVCITCEGKGCTHTHTLLLASIVETLI